MEKEYDIEKLNPRKNPYAKRVKKQITINIDGDTIDFFKAKSEKCGIRTGDRRSTQGRERRTVKALYLHGQPERF